MTQPRIQPCRIAIIGLGKIAADQHVPAIMASADFELVATVDPAASGLGGIAHFASFDALLASGLAIDAVAVCTPPQWRREIARAAIAAEKHVLLEKPPGADLAEASALADAAQASDVTVFAAWHSRYAAGVEPARAWLAGKAIHAVAVTWREDVRVWHPGQTWIWREGGFGVFDPGINALSIITAILPHPIEVTAGALQVPANCAAPVSAQITMRDAGGVSVAVDLDFLQTGPQTWDIRIDTDAGELLLSLGGSVLRTPVGEVRAEDREYANLYRHFAALIAAGESAVDLEPLRLVNEAFDRCTVEQVAEYHE